MIQRLQSIFLLLGGLSLGGTFAFPYADSASPIPGTLFADGFFSNADHIILIALMAVGALTALCAIFLYANRKLQINLAWASILCTLGAVGFGVFYFMQQGAAMGSVPVDGELGAALPVVGLLGDFLAIRYIKADERLVRSADRLR